MFQEKILVRYQRILTPNHFIICVIICLIFSSISSLAQPNFRFTQHWENRSIFNPAAINNIYLLSKGEHRLSVGSSFRQRVYKFNSQQNPSTSLLRGEYIFELSNVICFGGGHFYKDQFGATAVGSAYARIGVLFPFGESPENAGLILGVNGGLDWFEIDEDKISYIDFNDPLDGAGFQQNFPNLGFGLFFYNYFSNWDPSRIFNSNQGKGNGFYIGISAPRIKWYNDLESNEGRFDVQNRGLDNTYIMLGGAWSFTKSENLLLEPVLWLKHWEDHDWHCVYSLRIKVNAGKLENILEDYNKVFWFGLGYSNAKTLLGEGGLIIGKEDGWLWKIGGGYDYSLTDYGTNIQGWEINLEVFPNFK